MIQFFINDQLNDNYETLRFQRMYKSYQLPRGSDQVSHTIYFDPKKLSSNDISFYIYDTAKFQH